MEERGVEKAKTCRGGYRGRLWEQDQSGSDSFP